VADDEQAKLPAPGYIQHSPPDACLGEGVEHGGHLIAEKIAGARRECAHQTDTLQFAAGKFVGVTGKPRWFNAEVPQQRGIRRPGLCQNIPRLPAGVDGQFRVLKKELDRAMARFGQGPSVYHHASSTGGQIAGQQLCQGGFSPAAWAGKADNLPRSYPQIKIIK